MDKTREIFEKQLVGQQRALALKAPDYPEFLDVLVAKELRARLELIERNFQHCLVVGQVAGAFLQEIKLSEKLQQITTFESVAHDSEWLPFKENSLDCIIAPPGFELVNDLPGVLIQINRALKPDGLFLAAMFGGNTLVELRHVWLQGDDQLRGGASPRVAPFIDVRQAGNLLQRAGFALPVADMDTLCVRYESALSLMVEVKKMGFSNVLGARSRRLVSPELLKLVGELYGQQFSDADGRIRATLEINYLTGWRPHESQQKPLKPGSAQHRLADALGEKIKED